MKSAIAASAFAGPAPQPETRTLQTAASVAMASGATRQITNTGKAAGWLGRSTKGRRAMILGAESNSSALHQAPAAGISKAGTRPRSPLEADTAATTPAAPMWGTNGTVKP